MPRIRSLLPSKSVVVARLCADATIAETVIVAVTRAEGEAKAGYRRSAMKRKATSTASAEKRQQCVVLCGKVNVSVIDSLRTAAEIHSTAQAGARSGCPQ